MPFATTEHLNLRAWREGDKPFFVALENDPRVTRTSWGDFVVPKGEKTWEKTEEFLNSALLAIVVEVKREYAHLRKVEAEEEKKTADEKKPEDWDRELFAGYLMLHTQGQKNRDAFVMLSLVAPWWGNGFATETLQWTVKHAFEQLGMHRMSLGVFEGNPGAKRCTRSAALWRKGDGGTRYGRMVVGKM